MTNDSHRPEYVTIHADVPGAAMWSYYRMLETPDVVRRVAGDRAPEENLVAARDTIRQARAYFSAAQGSPLLTRPVLAYYGMVSLAKLLLLLDSKQPRTLREIEEVERKGHGLKQHDVLVDGAFSLEASEIEVTGDGSRAPFRPRGMFPLLAEVVLGSEASRWLGKRVSVLQLVRSVPQLATVLEQALGADRGYLGAEVSHNTSADGSVELQPDLDHPSGPKTAEDVLARAPYLNDCGAIVVATGGSRPDQRQVAIKFPSSATAYEVASREEFAPGAAALPPDLHGVRFDSLLASYALMYALSIVARYKPDRWASILDGNGSSLLPVIESFIPVAERWWPNLLLNRLTGKWIHFGQPSYF